MILAQAKQGTPRRHSRRLLAFLCVSTLSAALPRTARAEDTVETNRDEVEAEKVRVKIVSDHEDTVLLRFEGMSQGSGSAGGRTVYVSSEHYTPVCTAPCTARLSTQDFYTIGGGVTPTSVFRLSPDTTRVSVEGGSLSKRRWGGASLYLGIPAVVVGGTFVLLANVLPSYGKDTSTQDSIGTAGWITLGAGIGLTTLGIVLMATSGTNVVQEKGPKTLGMKLPGKMTLTPSGTVVF